MPRRLPPLPGPLRGRPFTVAEARAGDVAAHRLRAGDLHTPFHGIRLPAARRETESPDEETLILCRALALTLGPRAFFSGVTAAVLMGAPLPRHHESPRPLHVAVPAPHRAPVARGVAGHSLQCRPDELWTWRGLPVTRPERTWCDLGRMLTVPDLVAVGDHLIRRKRPLTDRDRIGRALGRYPGRRGLRRLREALPLLDDRAESRRESRLRVLLVQDGVTGLEPNRWITTSGGFRYRGDIVFPGPKVIVEYQSDYHADPAQYRADMTRIARLEADGWQVIQVNADDLRDPAELLARIRRVLRRRTPR